MVVFALSPFPSQTLLFFSGVAEVISFLNGARPMNLLAYSTFLAKSLGVTLAVAAGVYLGYIYLCVCYIGMCISVCVCVVSSLYDITSIYVYEYLSIHLC